MSDSDGSLQRDDLHHRRSRSRSPVSSGCVAETPGEREERRLAEVAVPVGLPPGQLPAAPSDPEPPPPRLALARAAAPAAQAVAAAALPAGGAPDAPPDWPLWAAASAPADRNAALGRLLVRGTGAPPAQGASLGQLPGPATAATEGREGARYRTHTQYSNTHVRPPKPYPPKAAFPEGRPPPVPAPTPKRTPMGITLPQLQRRVVLAGHEGAGGHGGDVARTVRGESTEPQGRKKKATVEGRQAAEEGGGLQGRAKAGAAAGGAQARGKGQGLSSS